MTTSEYLSSINNPLKLGFYLFLKLPAAWFMGIGLRHCDEKSSAVTLPYGWRSQNPFRSIYFAAQCAAGEFSTGILGQAHLQGKQPVSMLVTKIEAEFFKKAAATLTFTCSEGAEVEQVIQKAIETGEPQTIRMTSTGTLPDGELASKVYLTWSFRRK